MSLFSTIDMIPTRRDKLRRKMEFFFSDANLEKGSPLLKIATNFPSRYIPISKIMTVPEFKNVVNLSSDELIMAISKSSLLELNMDKSGVRRIDHYHPQPPINREVQIARTVYIENFPLSIDREDLAFLLDFIGQIIHINIPTDQVTSSHKNYAFIEFSSASEANNCVRLLHEAWPQTWPTRRDGKLLVVRTLKDWLNVRDRLAQNRRPGDIKSLESHVEACKDSLKGLGLGGLDSEVKAFAEYEGDAKKTNKLNSSTIILNNNSISSIENEGWNQNSSKDLKNNNQLPNSNSFSLCSPSISFIGSSTPFPPTQHNVPSSLLSPLNVQLNPYSSIPISGNQNLNYSFSHSHISQSTPPVTEATITISNEIANQSNNTPSHLTTETTSNCFNPSPLFCPSSNNNKSSNNQVNKDDILFASSSQCTLSSPTPLYNQLPSLSPNSTFASANPANPATPPPSVSCLQPDLLKFQKDLLTSMLPPSARPASRVLLISNLGPTETESTLRQYLSHVIKVERIDIRKQVPVASPRINSTEEDGNAMNSNSLYSGGTSNHLTANHAASRLKSNGSGKYYSHAMEFSNGSNLRDATEKHMSVDNTNYRSNNSNNTITNSKEFINSSITGINSNKNNNQSDPSHILYEIASKSPPMLSERERNYIEACSTSFTPDRLPSGSPLLLKEAFVRLNSVDQWPVLLMDIFLSRRNISSTGSIPVMRILDPIEESTYWRWIFARKATLVNENVAKRIEDFSKLHESLQYLQLGSNIKFKVGAMEEARRQLNISGTTNDVSLIASNPAGAAKDEVYDDTVFNQATEDCDRLNSLKNVGPKVSNNNNNNNNNNNAGSNLIGIPTGTNNQMESNSVRPIKSLFADPVLIGDVIELFYEYDLLLDLDDADSNNNVDDYITSNQPQMMDGSHRNKSLMMKIDHISNTVQQMQKAMDNFSSQVHTSIPYQNQLKRENQFPLNLSHSDANAAGENSNLVQQADNKPQLYTSKHRTVCQVCKLPELKISDSKLFTSTVNNQFNPLRDLGAHSTKEASNGGPMFHPHEVFQNGFCICSDERKALALVRRRRILRRRRRLHLLRKQRRTEPIWMKGSAGGKFDASRTIANRAGRHFSLGKGGKAFTNGRYVPEEVQLNMDEYNVMEDTEETANSYYHAGAHGMDQEGRNQFPTGGKPTTRERRRNHYEEREGEGQQFTSEEEENELDYRQYDYQGQVHHFNQNYSDYANTAGYHKYRGQKSYEAEDADESYLSETSWTDGFEKDNDDDDGYDSVLEEEDDDLYESSSSTSSEGGAYSMDPQFYDERERLKYIQQQQQQRENNMNYSQLSSAKKRQALLSRKTTNLSRNSPQYNNNRRNTNMNIMRVQSQNVENSTHPLIPFRGGKSKRGKGACIPHRVVAGKGYTRANNYHRAHEVVQLNEDEEDKHDSDHHSLDEEEASASHSGKYQLDDGSSSSLRDEQHYNFKPLSNDHRHSRNNSRRIYDDEEESYNEIDKDDDENNEDEFIKNENNFDEDNSEFDIHTSLPPLYQHNYTGGKGKTSNEIFRKVGGKGFSRRHFASKENKISQGSITSRNITLSSSCDSNPSCHSKVENRDTVEELNTVVNDSSSIHNQQTVSSIKMNSTPAHQGDYRQVHLLKGSGKAGGKYRFIKFQDKEPYSSRDCCSSVDSSCINDENTVDATSSSQRQSNDKKEENFLNESTSNSHKTSLSVNASSNTCKREEERSSSEESGQQVVYVVDSQGKIGGKGAKGVVFSVLPTRKVASSRDDYENLNNVTEEEKNHEQKDGGIRSRCHLKDEDLTIIGGGGLGGGMGKTKQILSSCISSLSKFTSSACSSSAPFENASNIHTEDSEPSFTEESGKNSVDDINSSDYDGNEDKKFAHRDSKNSTREKENQLKTHEIQDHLNSVDALVDINDDEANQAVTILTTPLFKLVNDTSNSLYCTDDNNNSASNNKNKISNDSIIQIPAEYHISSQTMPNLASSTAAVSPNNLMIGAKPLISAVNLPPFTHPDYSNTIINNNSNNNNNLQHQQHNTNDIKNKFDDRAVTMGLQQHIIDNTINSCTSNDGGGGSGTPPISNRVGTTLRQHSSLLASPSNFMDSNHYAYKHEGNEVNRASSIVIDNQVFMSSNPIDSTLNSNATKPVDNSTDRIIHMNQLESNKISIDGDMHGNEFILQNKDNQQQQQQQERKFQLQNVELSSQSNPTISFFDSSTKSNMEFHLSPSININTSNNNNQDNYIIDTTNSCNNNNNFNSIVNAPSSSPSNFQQQPHNFEKVLSPAPISSHVDHSFSCERNKQELHFSISTPLPVTHLSSTCPGASQNFQMEVQTSSFSTNLTNHAPGGAEPFKSDGNVVVNHLSPLITPAQTEGTHHAVRKLNIVPSPCIFENSDISKDRSVFMLNTGGANQEIPNSSPPHNPPMCLLKSVPSLQQVVEQQVSDDASNNNSFVVKNLPSESYIDDTDRDVDMADNLAVNDITHAVHTFPNRTILASNEVRRSPPPLPTPQWIDHHLCGMMENLSGANPPGIHIQPSMSPRPPLPLLTSNNHAVGSSTFPLTPYLTVATASNVQAHPSSNPTNLNAIMQRHATHASVSPPLFVRSSSSVHMNSHPPTLATTDPLSAPLGIPQCSNSANPLFPSQHYYPPLAVGVSSYLPSNSAMSPGALLSPAGGGTTFYSSNIAGNGTLTLNSPLHPSLRPVPTTFQILSFLQQKQNSLNSTGQLASNNFAGTGGDVSSSAALRSPTHQQHLGALHASVSPATNNILNQSDSMMMAMSPGINSQYNSRSFNEVSIVESLGLKHAHVMLPTSAALDMERFHSQNRTAVIANSPPFMLTGTALSGQVPPSNLDFSRSNSNNNNSINNIILHDRVYPENQFDVDDTHKLKAPPPIFEAASQSGSGAGPIGISKYLVNIFSNLNNNPGREGENSQRGGNKSPIVNQTSQSEENHDVSNKQLKEETKDAFPTLPRMIDDHDHQGNPINNNNNNSSTTATHKNILLVNNTEFSQQQQQQQHHHHKTPLVHPYPNHNKYNIQDQNEARIEALYPTPRYQRHYHQSSTHPTTTTTSAHLNNVPSLPLPVLPQQQSRMPSLISLPPTNQFQQQQQQQHRPTGVLPTSPALLLPTSLRPASIPRAPLAILNTSRLPRGVSSLPLASLALFISRLAFEARSVAGSALSIPLYAPLNARGIQIKAYHLHAALAEAKLLLDTKIFSSTYPPSSTTCNLQSNGASAHANQINGTLNAPESHLTPLLPADVSETRRQKLLANFYVAQQALFEACLLFLFGSQQESLTRVNYVNYVSNVIPPQQQQQHTNLIQQSQNTISSPLFIVSFLDSLPHHGGLQVPPPHSSSVVARSTCVKISRDATHIPSPSLLRHSFKHVQAEARRKFFRSIATTAALKGGIALHVAPKCVKSSLGHAISLTAKFALQSAVSTALKAHKNMLLMEEERIKNNNDTESRQDDFMDDSLTVANAVSMHRGEFTDRFIDDLDDNDDGVHMLELKDRSMLGDDFDFDQGWVRDDEFRNRIVIKRGSENSFDAASNFLHSKTPQSALLPFVGGRSSVSGSHSRRYGSIANSSSLYEEYPYQPLLPPNQDVQRQPILQQQQQSQQHNIHFIIVPSPHKPCKSQEIKSSNTEEENSTLSLTTASYLTENKNLFNQKSKNTSLNSDVHLHTSLLGMKNPVTVSVRVSSQPLNEDFIPMPDHSIINLPANSSHNSSSCLRTTLQNATASVSLTAKSNVPLHIAPSAPPSNANDSSFSATTALPANLTCPPPVRRRMSRATRSGNHEPWRSELTAHNRAPLLHEEAMELMASVHHAVDDESKPTPEALAMNQLREQAFSSELVDEKRRLHEFAMAIKTVSADLAAVSDGVTRPDLIALGNSPSLWSQRKQFPHPAIALTPLVLDDSNNQNVAFNKGPNNRIHNNSSRSPPQSNMRANALNHMHTSPSDKFPRASNRSDAPVLSPSQIANNLLSSIQHIIDDSKLVLNRATAGIKALEDKSLVLANGVVKVHSLPHHQQQNNPSNKPFPVRAASVNRPIDSSNGSPSSRSHHRPSLAMPPLLPSASASANQAAVPFNLVPKNAKSRRRSGHRLTKRRQKARAIWSIEASMENDVAAYVADGANLDKIISNHLTELQSTATKISSIEENERKLTIEMAHSGGLGAGKLNLMRISSHGKVNIGRGKSAISDETCVMKHKNEKRRSRNSEQTNNITDPSSSFSEEDDKYTASFYESSSPPPKRIKLNESDMAFGQVKTSSLPQLLDKISEQGRQLKEVATLLIARATAALTIIALAFKVKRALLSGYPSLLDGFALSRDMNSFRDVAASAGVHISTHSLPSYVLKKLNDRRLRNKTSLRCEIDDISFARFTTGRLLCWDSNMLIFKPHTKKRLKCLGPNSTSTFLQSALSSGETSAPTSQHAHDQYLTQSNGLHKSAGVFGEVYKSGTVVQTVVHPRSLRKSIFYGESRRPQFGLFKTLLRKVNTRLKLRQNRMMDIMQQQHIPHPHIDNVDMSLFPHSVPIIDNMAHESQIPDSDINKNRDPYTMNYAHSDYHGYLPNSLNINNFFNSATQAQSNNLLFRQNHLTSSFSAFVASKKSSQNEVYSTFQNNNYTISNTYPNINPSSDQRTRQNITQNNSIFYHHYDQKRKQNLSQNHYLHGRNYSNFSNNREDKTLSNNINTVYTTNIDSNNENDAKTSSTNNPPGNIHSNINRTANTNPPNTSLVQYKSPLQKQKSFTRISSRNASPITTALFSPAVSPAFGSLPSPLNKASRKHFSPSNSPMPKSRSSQSPPFAPAASRSKIRLPPAPMSHPIAHIDNSVNDYPIFSVIKRSVFKGSLENTQESGDNIEHSATIPAKKAKYMISEQFKKTQQQHSSNNNDVCNLQELDLSSIPQMEASAEAAATALSPLVVAKPFQLNSSNVANRKPFHLVFKQNVSTLTSRRNLKLDDSNLQPSSNNSESGDEEDHVS